VHAADQSYTTHTVTSASGETLLTLPKCTTSALDASCSWLAPAVCVYRHEVVHTYASVSPGPGEYRALGSINTKGKGITMGQRLKQKDSEVLPGPADYDLQESTLGVAARP
jgi:hypothetical protein